MPVQCMPVQSHFPPVTLLSGLASRSGFKPLRGSNNVWKFQTGKSSILKISSFLRVMPWGWRTHLPGRQLCRWNYLEGSRHWLSFRPAVAEPAATHMRDIGITDWENKMFWKKRPKKLKSYKDAKGSFKFYHDKWQCWQWQSKAVQ